MDSSGFSQFVLGLVTELMTGISAAYIEQESKIIDILSEAAQPVNADEIRKTIEADLKEAGLKLTKKQIDLQVDASVAMREALNVRLQSQTFPRVFVERGEINAKFIFEGEDGFDETESAKSVPAPTPSGSAPADTSSTSKVAQPTRIAGGNLKRISASSASAQALSRPTAVRSDLSATLKIPAVAKMMGEGAVPRAVIKPVSTKNVDPKGGGGELISEIRLQFRTVTE